MPKSKNKEADTSLKRGVKCFVQVNGGKGLAFTVTEMVNVERGESADGYQVYATTEKEMSDAGIVEAYRSRKSIEKVIRTLKSCLGLGPVYLSKEEHVLGHVYVHALAYQLRSVIGLKLKEGQIPMTAEQALWELEKLQVAELPVKGDEIHAARKLTRMGKATASLMHLFFQTAVKHRFQA
jgi:transposase